MGLNSKFDPWDVERHQGFLATQHDRTGEEMWVLEGDYEKLLELWSNQCEKLQQFYKKHGMV